MEKLRSGPEKGTGTDRVQISRASFEPVAPKRYAGLIEQ
jgi:hypothetical protein